jgi:hypothetical protein
VGFEVGAADGALTTNVVVPLEAVKLEEPE